MTVRQDIVDLLLTGMVPDKSSPTGLRHNDGTAYTPEERGLAGQAGITELMAASDALMARKARLDQEVALAERAAELIAPYAELHGEDLTVGQARELMNSAERAELDEIGERLAATATA